jgi:hypothetical protein
MSNIEERIRKSLTTEDQEFLAQLDADQSIYREVTAAFRGHMRWLNALAWLMGTALFVLAVFSGWRAVEQTEVRTTLLWSGCCGLALMGVALLKIWFWLELKANAIVREIKRVELQVASLAAARQPGGAR